MASAGAAAAATTDGSGASATTAGGGGASESYAELAAEFPPDVFPLHKLQHPKTQLPLAVVVLCGSFSPVTLMHVRALEMARDELQVRRGLCEVVGGYLSPVHDAYGKASLRAVTAADRAHMCALATADSCWLACSTWELQPARAHGWTHTATTLARYSAWLNACGVYPRHRGPVRVVLVAGADVVQSFATPRLWSRAHLHAITYDHGLAIIPRAGSSIAAGLKAAHADFETVAGAIVRPPGHSNFPLVVTVQSGGVENTVSSTAVRDAVAAGRSIKYLVPDAVACLLLDRGLYAAPCNCHAALASDGTASTAAPLTGAAAVTAATAAVAVQHVAPCPRSHVMRANYPAIRSRL